jgi:predicted PurR-regulated permease PerM
VAAWSLVGIAVLFVTVALLLMVLRSIALALVIALFLAVVFAPLVDVLARRGLPRPARAAAATLVVVAVAAAAAFLVFSGMVSQQQEISQNLGDAVAKLQGILTLAGMSATAADSAEGSVRSCSPACFYSRTAIASRRGSAN